jgi:hypothetical protein
VELIIGRRKVSTKAVAASRDGLYEWYQVPRDCLGVNEVLLRCMSESCREGLYDSEW